MRRLTRTLIIGLTLISAFAPLNLVFAKDYKIDVDGAHAFVQFRVKHLGFSWLYGRFNDFDGSFSYDPNDDSKNRVEVTVDVASIDSNHAERDKHLRSKDYFNVSKYPTANFVGTKYETTGEGLAKLTGELTLLGVTKEITLDVEYIGAGKSPWGDERIGFEGRTTINAQDFGVPASWLTEVDLIWSVEGIHK